MIDWRGALYVGLGGGVGSLARYVTGIAMVQRFGPGFPYGTLTINVVGCFVIGVVSQLALTRAFGMTPNLRLFLTVGVLGGFTTFSTFAYETVTLAGEGAPTLGALYIAASVGLGTIAAFAGIVLTRIAT